MNINDRIKNELMDLGFSAAGISLPTPPPHLGVYQRWLEQGRHADMGYLATERARTYRAQPEHILPGSGAVIVAALAYPGQSGPASPATGSPRGRIASYAWGIDYHHLIPQRLNQAVERLQAIFGRSVSSRSYTDTGPILEREFSQRSGLGWIGKNTCLIIPGYGSYFLLGEIFIDADLTPDEPFSFDRCGSCRRCIDACPTGCIQEDRTLDARECISYLTIENKGAIPASLRPALGDWVFGCDVCQQVCPWNLRFASPKSDPGLEPDPQRAAPDLLQDLLLTSSGFSQKFRLSPLKRAKRRGYLRNVAVALGNSGDRSAVFALIQTLTNEEEALVRGHAAWALGRLGGAAARQALDTALLHENDPQARSEVENALQRSASG
jgi:epoxyqueuosine reductase